MWLLNQEFLGFSVKVMINCAGGAFLLWFMDRDADLEKFSFARVTSSIENDLLRAVVEGLLFVLVGTYVALLLAHPFTGRQAFAAGIGWTASFNSVSGRVHRSSNKRSKKDKGVEKKGKG